MPQSRLTNPPDSQMRPAYTIELHDIPEALLLRLDERARATGSNRSQVVRAILARELGNEESEATSRGFDAVLGPIRQGFAESGTSEDEVTALLEYSLKAVRQRQREPPT